MTHTSQARLSLEIRALVNEGAPPHLIMSECERLTLFFLMDKNKQNQSKTARDLKINRGTLRAKLKKYGMI